VISYDHKSSIKVQNELSRNTTYNGQKMHP